MFDDLLDIAKRRLREHGWAVGDDLDSVRARLAPDEPVERQVHGYDDDEHERLLWVATPRRLFLVERERFERDVRELPYDAVRAIQQRPGRRGAALALVTRRETYVMDDVDEARAQAFATYVAQRVAALRGPRDGAAETHADGPTRATEPAAITRSARVSTAIRDLAELREHGLLTPEEFETEKRRILDGV